MRAPLSLPPHEDTTKGRQSGNPESGPYYTLNHRRLDLGLAGLQNQENKSLQLMSCAIHSNLWQQPAWRTLPSLQPVRTLSPLVAFLCLSTCRTSVGGQADLQPAWGKGRGCASQGGFQKLIARAVPRGHCWPPLPALPTTMGSRGWGWVWFCLEGSRPQVSVHFQNRSLRRNWEGGRASWTFTV